MAEKQDPYRELKAAIADLQEKVRDQEAHIEALEKDQGIEGAIKQLDKTISALPIATLGPVYKFHDGEAEAIGELRSSLSRPSFEVLELNLGRAAFPPNQSGKPTYQSRSKK